MRFLRFISMMVIAIILVHGFRNLVLADNTSKEYLGDGMLLIPAGEFIMGSSEKDGRLGESIGVDEVPQHIVKLNGFYIDKYEVTNRQYKAFIAVTGHDAPVDIFEGIYSWKKNSPPSGQEDIPVTHVSWFDADAYCRWAGKRLPIEAEWEKAARGTDGRQWPWGNDLRGKACNIKYTGPGRILPVGNMPEDVSPYGVYDMCGNVSEWTSSWYLPYEGSSLQRETFGEQFKVTRGGSWIMPAIPYSRVAYRANTSSIDFKHRGIGFRCVKDVGEK